MNKYIVKREYDIVFDSETKPLIMGSERYEWTFIFQIILFLKSKVKLL